MKWLFHVVRFGVFIKNQFKFQVVKDNLYFSVGQKINSGTKSATFFCIFLNFYTVLMSERNDGLLSIAARLVGSMGTAHPVDLLSIPQESAFILNTGNHLHFCCLFHKRNRQYHK